jgi:hypothetical protein
VAPTPYGSNSIRYGQETNAPTPCGSKPGVISGGNASIVYGQEGNAPTPCGSKPGIISSALSYGQETNPDPVPCGSKPGVASGTT